MAFVFKFPDLGEGVHEGKIVKWLVKEGDVVKADQIIGEVETDKAIVELPCPASGTMLKLYFKEGEVVKVGQILLVIGQPGEEMPPQIAGEHHEGVEHAKVAPLKAGEAHKLGLEHEKMHVTVHGERPAAPVVPTVPSAPGTVLATPAVRQLARQLGVDLSAVRGSGHGGRVTVEDVQKAAVAKKTQGQQTAAEMQSLQPPVAMPSTAVSQDIASALTQAIQAIVEQAVAKKMAGMQQQPSTKPMQFDGPVERQSLSTLRKAVAKKMAESVRAAPQVAHWDEADVTDLWALREAHKESAKAQGIHLTLLPFIAKALLQTLKEFPAFNASFDEAPQEIVLKKYYNLGIAVDTPDGLIVVVVKEADEKSVLQLAKEINELAEKARDRRASLDEIRGSTFTITNIGSVGGAGAAPIINYPEVAILGLFRMREQLRVVNGAPALRKTMPLSITFDHRVIDGADAARFMNALVAKLQAPSQLWPA